MTQSVNHCVKAYGRHSTGRIVAVHTVLLSLLAAGFCAWSSAQVRIAQIGSNPFLSAEFFPQDMQQWPVSGLTYSPTYAKLPFWGRIDDPQSRPNGNYTSTGLSIDGFSHTAKIHSVTNGLSYTQRLSPNSFAFAGMDLDVDARYNGAAGTLHGRDSNNNIIPGSDLPFDYSMLHTLGTGRFTGAGALSAWGVPAGVRLQFGLQTTTSLDHSLKYTIHDSASSSDRATWGWTTSPCAHVFGLTGPEGDTWLQNGYATGPLYSFDLQAGATLPFGKSGIRFSTLNGHQDYYEWRIDSGAFSTSPGNSKIDSNFVGHYEKQDWSRTTGGLTAQLYTNYTLRSHDRFALGLFSRIGYHGITNGEALSGNSDVTGGDKSASHGVSLDVAPNLTIPFGSLFSYIDVAVPVRYGYARKSNTTMRWVGGGQIRAFWDTHTSNEDESVWEPFSYANMHDVSMGVDFSTMFPLVNSPSMQLGLGLQLLINAGATFIDKSYGDNTVNGSAVDFTVSQKRFDYEGRKQFSTGVKLQYQGGRSFGWLEITEPLLQAVRPVTKVTDASGKQVYFEHEKEPLWLSMQGMRFGVYYSYQMAIPWLSGFNAR